MLTVVCVVAMLCGLILGGCEENSDLENGEQVVVVEVRKVRKNRCLTFCAYRWKIQRCSCLPETY